MKCTGLIFKAHSSMFWNEKKTRLEAKFQLRLMKRMSCKCEQCDEVFKALDNEHLFKDVYIHKMMPLDLMESYNTYLVAKPTWYDGGGDEKSGVSDIDFKVLSYTPKNIIRGKSK